jgi:predicted GNAT family acetyltransferase
LDDVRRQGKIVVPLCPFVAAFIGKHPEYVDLVDDAYRAQFDEPTT